MWLLDKLELFLAEIAASMVADKIGHTAFLAGIALFAVLVAYAVLFRLLGGAAIAERPRPLHYERGPRSSEWGDPIESHHWESLQGLISFGEFLRILRSKKDLTINSLAADLSLPPTVVSRLESGEILPTKKIVEDIAHCLKLSKAENSLLRQLAQRSSLRDE
jgi:Helix-turn-helix domain